MADWADRAWHEHLLPELGEDEVRKSFRAQFEAHERLQAWVWEHRLLPRSAVEASHHFLLFSIFARATLTYRAIRRLCLGGYHQHADMLTRSLFEDFVTAYWSAQPHRREEALELLNAQYVYDQLKRYDAWMRLGLPGWTADMSEFEARRSELEKRFGAHGGRHWAPSIHKMLEEVMPSLPDDQMRYEVDLFFRLRHQANNQQLHTTASAIERTSTMTLDGAVHHFQVGQSPDLDEESMLASLFNSMTAYGWLFRLTAVERRLDVDSFDRFFVTLRSGFLALTPSQRHQIGRNAVCPCGSGRKYKVCHGRSEISGFSR